MNMPMFARSFATEVLPKRLDKTALWYIDIRNFRSVNPKFGFLRGNLVLKGLVDCIRSLLAHDHPVARLGADRFIFVTDGIGFDEAQAKFRELIEAVNEFADSNGVKTHLSLTGGMYYLRDVDFEAGDHNRAMDYASIAHRNAHRESHSILLMFTQEDLERDVRRITIEQSIDDALVNGQIEVWYQPQIDYTYGEVIGAEALARWNHPDMGWISPAEFIPILENCGKVHDLDLFVWEEACRNAGRWRNVSDGKPVPISVNVSRTEMFEEGLMEHFLELQRKYELPDGSLHLEVTESAFVEEADRLYSIIEKMREHNMMVEMDDFGSGLSSLNMLKDVPVDVVKLDMGFMRSAVNEDRGGVVLSSVIRMLQGLDTPIIAEGVETLEQAEMLKNMGCHLMQGFHFSRPMPLDEFEGFIASNNTVETSSKRKKRNSHLDELTSFDPASSYLFNDVMGGTMFFFAGDGTSESILVNDEFYEECGLERTVFGNSKVNPIEEIDAESRATLWRAAAEAREVGAAPCRAKVRITGRWIDCIMRYLGPSARGDVFSLNIYRSGELGSEDDNDAMQASQDGAWAQSLLDKIALSGFFKCAIDETLTFDYVSSSLIANSGLSREDFSRRCHNSFAECVVSANRPDVIAAIHEAADDGSLVEVEFNVFHGFSEERTVKMFGRAEYDEYGKPWLYAMTLEKDDQSLLSAGGANGRERIIPFDYYVNEDRFVMRDVKPDGHVNEIEAFNWLARVEEMPENIAPSSASKILATVRDLKHHASSGFTDLKCNLRGSKSLRWFHINYTCEADENGGATVIHGYAQDANDQMGSAKWWRRQAEIDQLTGLLNRNAVEQDINLSMRTQGVGMMFMIDLDSFKSVNDELGHLAGDSLLRDVSRALADHFREGDVLGRYGGDEFVAFVPVAVGDPETIAAKRSEDIIKSIHNIEITDDTRAGCSVGVAISHNREATFYDLLEVADQAMYQSKLKGKGTYT
ncbi:MAG: EAL domain-containing protein, partial [Eggerthellaceae bacterium]|nr:EAL domain-containing protein [Eggerthellaceae bacterium]